MSRSFWYGEKTTKLIQLYIRDKKTVEEIAELLGRKRRSIIVKLRTMDIYEEPPTEPKPPTVMDLLHRLETLLDIEFDYNTNRILTKKYNIELLTDAAKEIYDSRHT